MFEYLKTYKNPYKGFVVFNIDTCEPVDPRAERKYGLEDNEVLFSIDNNIGDWKIHLD